MADIGIVILTLNGAKYFPKLSESIKNSTLPAKVLVIDSSSTDNTRELALKAGFQVHTIPKSAFNHGLTRELGRKMIGTKIVVFLTQDALPAHPEWLENLVKPLEKSALSYSRQLPHPGADFFEAFHRAYNYPETSHVRTLQDKERYGTYTFFLSNSSSAYLNHKLDEIGGFPHVLLGEDTYACSKLLEKGESVAYAADSKVHHSHSFTLKEEFKRSFDTGFARVQMKANTGDEKRGRAYAKTLLRQVNPLHLPYTCILLTVKWLGYKIGTKGHLLPQSIKKKLSSQPYFFK